MPIMFLRSIVTKYIIQPTMYVLFDGIKKNARYRYYYLLLSLAFFFIGFMHIHVDVPLSIKEFILHSILILTPVFLAIIAFEFLGRWFFKNRFWRIKVRMYGVWLVGAAIFIFEDFISSLLTHLPIHMMHDIEHKHLDIGYDPHSLPSQLTFFIALMSFVSLLMYFESRTTVYQRNESRDSNRHPPKDNGATDKGRALAFKCEGEDVRIPYSDIVYIQVEENYCHIWKRAACDRCETRYTIRSTLGEIEKQLPENSFLKTHRSFIVNLDHIENLATRDNKDVIITKSQCIIPVSKRRIQTLSRILHA